MYTCVESHVQTLLCVIQITKTNLIPLATLPTVQLNEGSASPRIPPVKSSFV